MKNKAHRVFYFSLACHTQQEGRRKNRGPSLCTHLHIDHMALGHLYRNAKFVVQRTELEGAFNPHPIQGLQFRDKSYFEKLNFQVIDGDTEISEGVKALLTPGHTRGTQSVMIDTKKGKAIIAGLCCIRENVEPGELVRKYMPVITTAIHFDAQQAFDSLLRIKREADIIIPLHDCEFAKGGGIP